MHFERAKAALGAERTVEPEGEASVAGAAWPGSRAAPRPPLSAAAFLLCLFFLALIRVSESRLCSSWLLLNLFSNETGFCCCSLGSGCPGELLCLGDGTGPWHRVTPGTGHSWLPPHRARGRCQPLARVVELAGDRLRRGEMSPFLVPSHCLASRALVWGLLG